MFNPDISNQNTSQKTSSNDLLNKSEICLFNFSKLKSRLNLTLSQNNSFNYDFSVNEQNEPKNKFKSPLIESDKNRYIKKVNIDVPYSKQILNQELKNDFINNYDDSFAKYCGLNKEQFSEIYFNNKYYPTVNEFGDINISIKNIVNILENFSYTKKVKITRRVNKRKKLKKSKKKMVQSKSKNLFKTNKIYSEKEKEDDDIKQDRIKDELNNVEDNDKREIKKDLKNIQHLVDNKNDNHNYNNKNEKSKTLFNIKKNLKNIIIPGKDKNQININDNNNFSILTGEMQNDNIKQNIDSENIINNNRINNNDNNKNNNSDNNKKQLTFENIIKNVPLNSKDYILSNQSFKQNLKSSNSINSNIFNFPSNIIQNEFKNPQNKSAYEILGRQAITPFIKSNNSLNMSLNDNLNNNIPSNRPLLSPMNFNPVLDNIDNILSPNLCEYSKDKISSPFYVNASPFNNNNYNDHFIFNNINNGSFFFGNNSENNNDHNSEEFFNNEKKEKNKNYDMDKNINKFNYNYGNNNKNESNYKNKIKED